MSNKSTSAPQRESEHEAVTNILSIINTCSTREAALQYASEFELPVFPATRDKVPYIKGWQRAATTDLDTIEGWFEEWPDANIGMPTGAISGVVVLDGDGEVGIANAESLLYGSIPILQSKTGGGGRHYLFRHPGNGLHVPNNAGKLKPKVDVRGDGGYVLLPPSKTSGVYQWLV